MEGRLDALNQEIQALSRALARSEQLERQFSDLDRQRDERRLRERQTAQLAAKEQEDVDKLESGGLRALLLSLAGDKEVRLSQERREALAARLQHEQAQRDLEDIQARIRALREEQRQLRTDRERLSALLEEKAALLKALGGAAGEALSALDQELEALEHQRREVQEALSAGRGARTALDRVIGSLKSAGNWGSWDMLGGGMLATMAKHERLDDARSGISCAQRALSQFRTELADVDLGGIHVPQVQIGEFATFADYFLDNFFSDWYVQQRIYDAQEGVGQVLRQVQRAIDGLEQLDRELERQQAALEERRAALIGAPAEL